jgi:LacI family transcriptional regulator
MAVTLQKIAEAAGVSRGTVDRALNNRGRIRPEVAKRIQEIAKEMGYQPNMAGRALAMAKRTVNIGVVLHSCETPFIREVLGGVNSAADEVRSMGGKVYIEALDGVHEKAVLEAMEKLRAKGCSGMAVIAMDTPRMNQKIREFIEVYNIQIVTFNADASESGRMCFVGQNGKQSGRTAAGLLGEMLGAGQTAAVLTGQEEHTALNDRVKGFQEEIGSCWTKLNLSDVKYTDDDEEKTCRAVEELLQQYPDLGGIYFTANGEEGLCRALKKHGKYGVVKVVAHDFGGKKTQYLRDGGIQFLLGQNSHVQGYQPIMILFHYLVNSERPEKEYQYTDIEICTRYNYKWDER